MQLVFAVIAGVLFAAGFYMMLRRSVLKLAIGLALIGHAANLTIFVAGGLTRARAAIVPPGADALASGVADPLPQALILTAIVISFGVVAFTIVLISAASRAAGTDDATCFAEIDA